MLPFVGGAGIGVRNSLKSFEDQPCDVNLSKPAERSVIYAGDGKTVIATLFAYNRTIVQPKDVPDLVKKAVVAIEDRRFYTHHGVDVQGLARAVIRNTQGGSQGGSTLTQQLVKQTRLYEAKTEEDRNRAVETTPTRKLSEAKCALTLEKKYSKEEILWRYINIANFGAGAYGIGTAASTYFNKPLNKLTIGEAAMLAGMVQSPTRTNLFNKPAAAVARRNVVIDEMQSLRYITAKQATAAKAERPKPAPKKPATQDCGNANKAIPNAGFFCTYLKTYLAGIGFPQQRLESGGFRIYTTLDANLQKQAQAAVMNKMPPDKRATAVMDLIDPTTGKIRAMAVSKFYGNNVKDKQQTALPLVTQPVAGAGSTYKLFTLVAALAQKIPLRAYTIKIGNEYQPSENCDQPGRETTPVQNAGRYADKPWSLEDATYESVNTFFVALLDQNMNCDPTRLVEYAERMGLNSLKTLKAPNSSKSVADAVKSEKQYSFTLGPGGTSPLELAAAYGVIANHGKYCAPTPVERIVGADGKPVGLPERNCTQVIPEPIANTVTHVLEKDTMPTFSGTANKKFASYYSDGGSPVGGKTGTASAKGGDDDGKNSAAWFVGITPKWTGSVAVFNPDNPNAALRDVPGFNTGGDVFGSFSASIWIEAMRGTLLNEGDWSFPPEDQEVVNGNSIEVPSVLGLDIGEATKRLEAEGFSLQVAEERKDFPLPKDRIGEQSPRGRAMPGQVISVVLSSGKPPPTRPGEQPGQGRPGQGRPGQGDGGIIVTPPGGRGPGG